MMIDVLLSPFMSSLSQIVIRCCIFQHFKSLSEECHNHVVGDKDTPHRRDSVSPNPLESKFNRVTCDQDLTMAWPYIDMTRLWPDLTRPDDNDDNSRGATSATLFPLLLKFPAELPTQVQIFWWCMLVRVSFSNLPALRVLFRSASRDDRRLGFASPEVSCQSSLHNYQQHQLSFSPSTILMSNCDDMYHHHLTSKLKWQSSRINCHYHLPPHHHHLEIVMICIITT